MSDKEFPYDGWVLMPSFSPKKVTLTEGCHGLYHITEKRKWYHLSDIFPSKQDAIRKGRELIDVQKADLDKRHDKLAKRIAALDKAES